MGPLLGMRSQIWNKYRPAEAHRARFVLPGHGTPVYGAAVGLDSRWMPGQMAIARRGALAACLGPAAPAGMVSSSTSVSVLHTMEAVWRMSQSKHNPIHGNLFLSGSGSVMSRCWLVQAHSSDEADSLMQRFPGPLISATPREKVTPPASCYSTYSLTCPCISGTLTWGGRPSLPYHRL